MKRLFTFLWIFIAFSMAARAGHVYGGSIGYKNLGNQKYEITVTMYRSCSGIQLSNMPVTAKCSTGTGSTNFTIPEVAVNDVTGVGQQCTTQSKCSGSYQYGIEEHIFRGVIDLSSFACCEVNISYDGGSGGARVTTTTTTGMNSFYLEAELNKCAGTSLFWENYMHVLLEAGKDHILNFAANDTLDRDSISYNLVEPLYYQGSPLAYVSPYSYTKPVSFLGFPNAGLNKPAGFHFDSKTANLTFRPTVSNQVTIIAVEATEWRNISGTMTKVGRTRKDIALTVIASTSNNIPYQNSSDTYFACKGDTSVAIIDIKDADASQNLSLKLSHRLKWAKAEMAGGLTARKVRVIYLADTIPPDGIYNAFTLEVKDDYCPLPGKTVKAYSLMPGGSTFTDSTTFTSLAACGKIKLKLTKKMAGNNFNYWWSVKGSGIFADQAGDSAEVAVPKGGWVNYELLVASSSHCNYYRYTDSIFVDSSHYIEAFAGLDDTVCQQTTFILTAQVKKGTAPFNYNWLGVSGTQNTTAGVTKGINKFYLEITDAKNCVAKDTLIILNSWPSVITPDKGTILCAQQTATFTTDSTLGIVNYQHTYSVDSNYISGTDKFIAYKEKLYLEDSAGCNAADSSLILVSYISTDLPVRTNYCKDSILTVAPVIHAGNQPLSYLWYTGSTTAVFSEKIMGIPANTVFLVKGTITDKYGCIDSAVGQAKVLPLPAVTITKPKDACTAGQVVNLTANGQPAGGLWTGTAIAGTTFSPSTAGKGNFPLSYRFTDIATGCVNGGTTDITVINPPVIDFTADTTKILPGRLVTFTNHTTADKAFNSFWRAGTMTTQAKDAVFLFSNLGEYDVTLKITDGVCPPDSVVKKNMIKVGSNYLSVINAGNNLSVYPNPASDKLYFNLDIGERVSSITVSDIAGKEITSAFTVTGNEILNSSNYKGICFITIITGDNRLYYAKVSWE